MSEHIPEASTPEGFNELMGIMMARSDPAAAATADWAEAQRIFRRQYAITHTMGEYGHLLATVSERIDTERSKIMTTEPEDFHA